MAGRKERKGTKGVAVEYISRSRAMRKLQLTKAEFRRLCILKGIFPRDPPHKNRIAGATRDPAAIYLAKDIRYLAHEPLVDHFRALRSFHKRMRRHVGKRDWTKARTTEQTMRPVISLEHLVKERYPTFADALRDLDDGLSLLALFAALPSTDDIAYARDAPAAAGLAGATQQEAAAYHQRGATPRACAQLLREFESAVTGLGGLRRVFVSVKGVYFQADVLGTPVTWLAPHGQVGLAAVPAAAADADAAPGVRDELIDWAAMRTFLDFHVTHVRAVNSRLFARLGWAYPPTHSDFVSGDRMPAPLLADAAAAPVQTPSFLAGAPLAGQRVFVSREVPLAAVAFVASGLGASAVLVEDLAAREAAGAAYVDVEADPEIKLQVVDRPRVAKTYAGRTYVQPQYLFDALNAYTASYASSVDGSATANSVDPALYRVGATLPAHLSPFVTPEDLGAESADEDAEDTPADATKTKKRASVGKRSAEERERAAALLSKKRQKLYARAAAEEAADAQDKKRKRAIRASAA